jgi:glycosyltransferase involved in cell wall biosynthesis
VDLFVEGLARAGRDHPAVKIEWCHFGDGPLEAEVEGLAAARLPENVTASFHGDTPNPEIRAFYRDQPVDALVNVSSSEGLPVSIMEAQNAGIPVIATAVGGTSELVNDANGLLLPANPDAAEIAEAIGDVIRHPDAWAAKRPASRRSWETFSDVDRNYSGFVQQLGQFFRP